MSVQLLDFVFGDHDAVLVVQDRQLLGVERARSISVELLKQVYGPYVLLDFCLGEEVFFLDPVRKALQELFVALGLQLGFA